MATFLESVEFHLSYCLKDLLGVIETSFTVITEPVEVVKEFLGVKELLESIEEIFRVL